MTSKLCECGHFDFGHVSFKGQYICLLFDSETKCKCKKFVLKEGGPHCKKIISYKKRCEDCLKRLRK